MKDKRNQQDFFDLVFQVVRQIPEGKITSYGAIARYLGIGSSARTVGWAMNASHHQKEYVPAHRVLNRNGQLTGKFHFNPPESMQQALEAEGVVVVEDQVQNFKNHYWDPAVELAL
jgi:methylated-DNA-protein-cysteine methyltransferase related protein